MGTILHASDFGAWYNTSPQQQAYIRTSVNPIRQQIRLTKQDEFVQAERIRYYLAHLSIIDGYEDDDVDSRDASVTHNRFVKTVLDSAIQNKVSVIQIIQQIKAVSSPKVTPRLQAIEETYRHRRHTLQKQESERLRQERLGKQPKSKRDQKPKRKHGDDVLLFEPKTSKDVDFDQPRRYMLSPRLRFGITAVVVSIVAVIVIAEGEDPRTVIFVTFIFLAITAVLYRTYYNRDWGK